MAALECCYRQTPVECVRFIWRLIKHNHDNKLPQGGHIQNLRHALIALSTSGIDGFVNPDKLTHYLELCVRDKLLSTADTTTFTIPSSEETTGAVTNSGATRDWYCFECHQPGTVYDCVSCHRVYHPNCALRAFPGQSNAEATHGQQWTCPICRSQALSINGDPKAEHVYNQVSKFLKWAHQKASQSGYSLSSLARSCDLNDEQHRLLIAKSIDLGMMKLHNESRKYRELSQFMADFQLLVHNVVILFGDKSEQARWAQEIFQQLNGEMQSINSNTLPNHVPSFDPHANVGLIDAGAYLANAGLNNNTTTAQQHSQQQQLQPQSVTFHANNSGKDEIERKKSIKRKSGEEKRPRNRNKKQSGGVDGSSSQKLVNNGIEYSAIDSCDQETNAASISSPTTQPSTSKELNCCCDCEERFRRAALQLQKQWLDDYLADKEKSLVELTMKLDETSRLGYDHIKDELKNQYRDEMEKTKTQLDAQYTQQLKQETQRINDRWKQQLSDVKKKQWCRVCENEAIYHCCWNTAYCTVECQQKHWSQHRRNCRRKNK